MNQINTTPVKIRQGDPGSNLGSLKGVDITYDIGNDSEARPAQTAGPSDRPKSTAEIDDTGNAIDKNFESVEP